MHFCLSSSTFTWLRHSFFLLFFSLLLIGYLLLVDLCAFWVSCIVVDIHAPAGRSQQKEDNRSKTRTTRRFWRRPTDFSSLLKGTGTQSPSRDGTSSLLGSSLLVHPAKWLGHFHGDFPFKSLRLSLSVCTVCTLSTFLFYFHALFPSFLQGIFSRGKFTTDRDAHPSVQQRPHFWFDCRIFKKKERIWFTICSFFLPLASDQYVAANRLMALYRMKELALKANKESDKKKKEKELIAFGL